MVLQMKRRMLTALLAAAVALPVVAAQSPTVAHAEDDLIEFRSNYTYTIDPAAGVVHVRAEFYVFNDDLAHAYRPGGYIGSINVPVPVSAVGGNGAQLGPQPYDYPPRQEARTLGGINISPIDGNTEYNMWSLVIRGSVVFKYYVRVILTYDITGTDIRTDSRFRMNDAYFGFDVFAPGDPGKASIHVVVPKPYTVDTLSDEWTTTTEGTNTIYSVEEIENPDEFFSFVAARDDEALISTSLTTAQADFDVKSWPGDPEWQQFVTTQIRDGVPVLEELIGEPWPLDREVDVRESVTPYVYGYAGWFDAVANEIEIGEDLDQEVVLHELSHAWFNRKWFEERWLSEGFAQVYSNLAVDELGGTPLQPLDIAADDPGKVTLDAWSNPDFSDADDERERYGYNASFSVVQQITDEIGVDRMSEVLAAISNRSLAYQSGGSSDTTTDATDWQRFLDLVERVGGSETAQDLMVRHVIQSKDRHLLQKREAALDDYAAIEEHGDDWATPLVVRRQMSAWEFGDATTSIEQAEAVLTMRDELDTAVDEIGTSYPAEVQAAYEEATERDLDDATATVKAHLDTAIVLLDAARADRGSHGIIGTIGLLGNDVDGTLDAAIDAFVAGDLATADAKAQEVITAVDDETSSGLIRLAILLGLSLLVTGGVVLTRRRRAAKALAATAQTESEQHVEDADLVAEQQVEDAEPAGELQLDVDADQEGPSPE